MFHSFLYVYQRVYPKISNDNCRDIPPSSVSSGGPRCILMPRSDRVYVVDLPRKSQKNI